MSDHKSGGPVSPVGIEQWMIRHLLPIHGLSLFLLEDHETALDIGLPNMYKNILITGKYWTPELNIGYAKVTTCRRVTAR